MADEYTKLLYLLAGIGLTGFVGFVLVKINDHGTRLAVLESKEGSIRDMKNSLDNLTKIVYEIAGKMGIAIRGD